MSSRIAPMVVNVPVRNEPALHIGDARTMSRRAPSMTVPAGSLPVLVPPPELSSSSPGALARERLVLPVRFEAVHFALPTDVQDGFGSLWKTCPVAGLDLPIEASREAWFREHSAVTTFLSPSSIGVEVSPNELSSVAWWLLRQVDTDALAPLLLGLSFRLDVAGPEGDLNAVLASLLAQRWRIGAGILHAAQAGRVWLNPRCLRWIVREVATADAAERCGMTIGPKPGIEAELFANMFFGHVLAGRPVDYSDVLAACWLLHEQFHGMSERQSVGDPFDPLSAMSALGFSSPGRLRLVERFATWSAIWRLPDNHRSAATHRWNGTSPDAVRAAFESSTGLAVHRWLGVSALVVLSLWSEAEKPVLKPATVSRSTVLDLFEDDLSAGERAADLLVAELSTTLEQLGEAVLDTTPTYSGLGSTSQTEASFLHQRPVITFPNGTWSISSPEAYATRAVELPRAVLDRRSLVGDRRRLGGVLGRMFEAHAWDVLNRLNGSHLVIEGDRIDTVAGAGSRGDAIVAKGDSVIVFEFSLQPTSDAASRGDRNEVLEVLRRYTEKLQQAIDTPHDVLDRFVPHLDVMRVGRIVVADEPLPISMVHVDAMRQIVSDVPDLFVISIDELESIVDLAEMSVSVPDALLAWMSGPRKAPFTHHISKLERIVRPNRRRLATALENLYHDATTVPPEDTPA